MKKSKYQSYADLLIGQHKQVSLEDRIFHTFCVIAAIALFLEIFFNYYIGLKTVALICFIGFVFSVLMLCISRVWRKTETAIVMLGVVANLIFSTNYIFNSGINGPNTLLFCILLIITIVIVPKHQLLGWFILNVAIVILLMLIEFYYPNIIKESYRSEEVRFVDTGVTYVVAAILIGFTIKFIRTNYDVERASVEAKSAELLEQSKHIISQNESLAQLVSEKAKLFSIVAHDIRSPLSSILGYLEVLNAVDLTLEEEKKMKSQLLKTTKETSEILANVLAWSKTQIKGAKVEMGILNVGDTLQNTLNIEKELASNKFINFRINVAADCLVHADVIMFKLVIRNLVTNALKFTEFGGNVTIDVEEKNNYCTISVIDDGIGINEADSEDLFMLKVDSTFGTNNEKGVGIGLLLCKEFSNLQGASVSYKPNGTKGSIFSITYLSAKTVSNSMQ